MIADVLNWGTWLAFATELVVMLWVVPHRWEWIRKNPLDTIVVVLTPPFLPGNFAAARLFRLLRLLRLLKIVPLLRGMLSLEGVKYAALLTVAAVIAGGAAFAAVEERGLSMWDGAWWAATTMTTIGSNIQPSTTAGRILALTMVVIGLSFVSFLTAFIADRFVNREVKSDVRTHEEHVLTELQDLREKLERIERKLG
jgi:voltage-gated potassium channel